MTYGKRRPSLGQLLAPCAAVFVGIVSAVTIWWLLTQSGVDLR